MIWRRSRIRVSSAQYVFNVRHLNKFRERMVRRAGFVPINEASISVILD